MQQKERQREMAVEPNMLKQTSVIYKVISTFPKTGQYTPFISDDVAIKVTSKKK